MDVAWLIIILVVLLVLIVWFSSHYNSRVRQLSRQREGLTREEYIAALKQKGYDEELVAVLYETLKFYLPKWFLLHPDDDIINGYGINAGDIDIFMRRVVEDNDLSFPPDEEMQAIYQQHNERVTAMYLLDILLHSK